MGCVFCIGDLLAFVLGVLVLRAGIKEGRIRLVGGWGVEGAAVPIIGFLLVLPVMCGPLLAGVYGFGVGINEGMQAAREKNGQLTDADKKALEARLQQKIEGPAAVIQTLGSASPFVLALLVAGLCAKRLDGGPDDAPGDERAGDRKEPADEEEPVRMRSCPMCCLDVPVTAQNCSWCGAALQEVAEDAPRPRASEKARSKKRRRDRCPSCGEPLDAADVACEHCGFDRGTAVQPDRD
ncbi:MAG TPA: zinc ribbon domain-containing protein [Gemmataceae bacterium]|nr:zinc ribbon domain-containing protein [Gemmataceae bacterium]